MAILPILLLPDPILRRRAAPVEAVDDGVRRLMDDMLETMYAAEGLGLAANQVGVLRRVIVMDCGDDDGDGESDGESDGENKRAPHPIRMANPEIIAKSDAPHTHEEGCLSIPGHVGKVVRPDSVTVRYLDETGAARELHAKGMLAVCVQHEIDHLNGVLFIDHLSKLKRDMIMRKIAKDAKQKSD